MSAKGEKINKNHNDQFKNMLIYMARLRNTHLAKCLPM